MNRHSLLLSRFGILCFVPHQPPSQQNPHVIKTVGDVEYTHDPSIIKDGDTWYLFGTNNGPEHAGERLVANIERNDFTAKQLGDLVATAMSDSH
jgi:hypothetical protein